jgi:hypothetical protein
MRASLFLAVGAVVAWSSVAFAQAPAAPIVNKGGGIAGTALGAGAGAAGVLGGVAGEGLGADPNLARRRATARSPIVIGGTGHIGAGTGGLGPNLGNAVGGIKDTAIGAGSGGVRDATSWGSALGGVNGVGRGLGAGSGGIKDLADIGINTGGINGSAVGAGTGGLQDLNTLGATTGGIKENNAPRFRLGQ